jgi:RHS repeat-associated protein
LRLVRVRLANDALGLIDMKGRMYDARIGRFLSADPAVQAPWDARSFNRYSYAWNNPLVMTDPTGYNACPDDPYVSGCDDAGNTTGETTVWGEGASESSYGDPECNDIDCGGVGEDEGMSVEDNLPEDGISEDDSGADGLGDGYFIVSPARERDGGLTPAHLGSLFSSWTIADDAQIPGGGRASKH